MDIYNQGVARSADPGYMKWSAIGQEYTGEKDRKLKGGREKRRKENEGSKFSFSCERKKKLHKEELGIETKAEIIGIWGQSVLRIQFDYK